MTLRHRPLILAIAALALLAAPSWAQQLPVAVLDGPARVDLGQPVFLGASGSVAPDGFDFAAIGPEGSPIPAVVPLFDGSGQLAYAIMRPSVAGRYTVVLVASGLAEGERKAQRAIAVWVVEVGNPRPPTPVPPDPGPGPGPVPPDPDPPSPVVAGPIHVVLLYDAETMDAMTGALRGDSGLAGTLAGFDATFFALEKDSEEARRWSATGDVSAPSVTFIDANNRKSVGYRAPTIGGMPDAAAVVDQVRKLRGK